MEVIEVIGICACDTGAAGVRMRKEFPPGASWSDGGAHATPGGSVPKVCEGSHMTDFVR